MTNQLINGKQYCGFGITVPGVDMEDSAKSIAKLTDPHTIELRLVVAGGCSSFLSRFDSFKKVVEKYDDKYCSILMDDMQVTMNELESSQGLQTFVYQLRFPDDIYLTTNILSPDSHDGTIAKLPVPFPYQHKVPGMQGIATSFRTVLLWKVTVVPLKERIHQKNGKKAVTDEDKMAEMMKMFAKNGMMNDDE